MQRHRELDSKESKFQDSRDEAQEVKHGGFARYGKIFD
jgi:hypothetical protein